MRGRTVSTEVGGMGQPSVDQHSQSWTGALRAVVIRLGRPIHRRLRQEKLDLFFSLTANRERNTLLDVGGNTGMDSEFLPLYQAFREVTVVNLDPSPDRQTLPHVRRMLADGCCLPFGDRSFDWVFSNAVLEHVGGIESQRKFGAEIARVARRGYFVTTPNKFFPIEPHTLLPLYQFLPERWQRKGVGISPYCGQVYQPIRLLTACGFKQMVMSNIDCPGLALDAENIALPDNSYPVVFAHAVLHHCRSPHKAIGEMVRVARQHVFFLEPNDSWAVRMLVRLGYSFPYELAAVAAHEYLHGGMRDGPIPNYI